jgi:hypothetical protein
VRQVCASCSRGLVLGEIISCDACEASRLRWLLEEGSPTRRYRPHVVPVLEADLAEIVGAERRPAWELS